MLLSPQQGLRCRTGEKARGGGEGEQNKTEHHDRAKLTKEKKGRKERSKEGKERKEKKRMC